MLRSVEVVEDVDAPGSYRRERLRAATSLLDPLTAPMLTQFRYEVRTRYSNGDPRFLCWKCGRPVYVSLSGAGNADDRDGRDAYFGHHAGTAEDCEWGTVGQNPRDIDAIKYGGVTEGEQHKSLKNSLALMLEADLDFGDIDIERIVKCQLGLRRPDVSARFLDREIAFDLQLATTQLPEIVARQNFYEQSRIRYVWVTDSNDPRRLTLQAFQDIYWENGGQIFAIDSQAKAISLEKRILHLWALTVMPRLDSNGWRTVWERRLVSRNEIDWSTPSGRPRFPGADFGIAVRRFSEGQFANPRRRLIDAVGRDDRTSERDAARAWNEIAGTLGVPRWREALPDKPFKAIGVLATAAARKKMDSSSFQPERLTAIFNNFLEMEQYRVWTSALQVVAKSHENEDLLDRDSSRRKITRNLDEGHTDLNRRYAPLLDIVFPNSAFLRVHGPPSEIKDT